MLHNARLLLLLASLTKLLLQPIPIQPLSKVLHSPLKPSLAGVQPLQERSCLTYCSFLPSFLHAPYLHINGTRSPWSCFCLSATTFVRIALLLILSHIGYFVAEGVPSKSCLERGRVRRDSLNTGFLQAKDLGFYFFPLSSVCFGLAKTLLETLIILTYYYYYYEIKFHLHFHFISRIRGLLSDKDYFIFDNSHVSCVTMSPCENGRKIPDQIKWSCQFFHLCRAHSVTGWP